MIWDKDVKTIDLERRLVWTEDGTEKPIIAMYDYDGQPTTDWRHAFSFTVEVAFGIHLTQDVDNFDMVTRQ